MTSRLNGVVFGDGMGIGNSQKAKPEKRDRRADTSIIVN